jgi:hypothetical protein
MLSKNQGFGVVNRGVELYDKSINNTESRKIARRLVYACPWCGITNTIDIPRGYKPEELIDACRRLPGPLDRCRFCGGATDASKAIIDLMLEEQEALAGKDTGAFGRIILPDNLEPLGGRKA